MIAKAGDPMVKVVPLGAPVSGEMCRLGFLTGRITVPDDFDLMGTEEIARPFRAKGLSYLLDTR